MSHKISSYSPPLLIRYDTFFVILLVAVQFFFWYGIKWGDDDNQTVLWKGSRSIKPNLAIVPDPPTDAAVKALSWGDEEFYFRTSALAIQNAGDTFGRTTSLKDYDYPMLYKWWMILDSLNSKSNFVPPLVSYYFGATQKPERDIPYVVKYLVQHADRDPAHKWWWYGQALIHAKYKLKDLDWALEIANKMAAIPEDVETPLWVRQMSAFILEAKGEYNAACNVILNIINNHDKIKEGEMNFMIHFITSRIKDLVAEKEGSPVLDKLNPQCRAIVEAEKAKLEELKQSKISK